MKVSIVTISFNQAPFLRRAIDSVLNQRGVDKEYIVVDPGSTDGSREIIDSYGPRINIRVYEPDEGPSDGLNKGFARATGDIYCYLNSDDTLAPGALSVVADYFEKHPDVDAICGHSWIVDANDNRIRRVWSHRPTPLGLAHTTSQIIQPSTFFRAAAFCNAGGFNTENRSTWDAELMVDMFLSGAKIEVVPYFLSTYRLHETSITSSGKLEEQMKLSRRMRFQKLMGREPHAGDRLMTQILRATRIVTRPRQSFERLVKGPVFRRKIN